MAIGIEQGLVPVRPAVAAEMAGTVSPAGVERDSGEMVVRIVAEIVIAVTVPGERRAVEKVGPGSRQVYYLPAALLEALKRLVGSLAPVHVHSFHKTEHSPVVLPH